MNSIASMLPFTIRAFNSHHVLYNFSGFKALLTPYSQQAITQPVLEMSIHGVRDAN